jgi:hypothetical protein
MRKLRELYVIQLGTLFFEDVYIAPVFSIVRNLDRAFRCARDLIELYPVKLAASAEIHVDPLLAKPGAHPCAGETVRTANLNPLIAPIEFNLADPPLDIEGLRRGVGHREFDLIETVSADPAENNRRNE